jgi:hypothetical protein
MEAVSQDLYLTVSLLNQVKVILSSGFSGGSSHAGEETLNRYISYFHIDLVSTSLASSALKPLNSAR